MGGSSPLAPPRNVRIALFRGLFTNSSSSMGSYSRACMVRLIIVFCPSSALTGGVFSFANLAKAAICGVFTQLGTRYKSRLLSKATAWGLPNFTDCLPKGALRMVRTGDTSPSAVNEKAEADELPILETHTSRFLASNEMPAGWFRAVFGL